MSEQSLFSLVVFQWLCYQVQSAWDVAAAQLLTFKANINHISPQNQSK